MMNFIILSCKKFFVFAGLFTTTIFYSNISLSKELKNFSGNLIVHPIHLCVEQGYKGCGLFDIRGYWKAPPIYQSMDFKSKIWVAKRSTNVTHILNMNGDKISAFKEAEVVSDNLLAATPFGRYGTGLYTFDGKEIVPPHYGYVKPFSEGLAGASDLATFNSNFETANGYIDKSGRWIIKPQFFSVGVFQSGLAPVTTASMSANENVLINKAGTIVTPYVKGYSYHWIGRNRWQSIYTTPEGDAAGVAIYNEKGKILREGIQIIGNAENDAAIYMQLEHGKEIYGIINIETLELIVPADKSGWIKADGFDNGVSMVILSEGGMYVDSRGVNIEPEDVKVANEVYRKLSEVNFFSANFKQTSENDNYNIISPQPDASPSVTDVQSDSVWWIRTGYLGNNGGMGILTNIDGKVFLTYRSVDHFNGQWCGSIFTILSDAENKTIWPDDPAAMCSALSRNPDINNPKVNSILEEIRKFNSRDGYAESSSYPRALKSHSDSYVGLVRNVVFDTPPPPPAGMVDNHTPIPGDKTLWIKGPATVQISDVAKIQIPVGYYFAPADKINRHSKKAPGYLSQLYYGDDKHVFYGVVMPETASWIASLAMDNFGFINTDSLSSMDQNEIIKRLSNRVSKTSEYNMVKWIISPLWNIDNQSLIWSVSYARAIPLLKGVKFGNRWVMSLTLQDIPFNDHEKVEVTDIKDEFSKFLATMVFNPGERYQDHKAGGPAPVMDATDIITGPPTAEELAIKKHIKEENEKRTKENSETLMHGLLLALLIILPGNFISIIRKKHSKIKTAGED